MVSKTLDAGFPGWFMPGCISLPAIPFRKNPNAFYESHKGKIADKIRDLS